MIKKNTCDEKKKKKKKVCNKLFFLGGWGVGRGVTEFITKTVFLEQNAVHFSHPFSFIYYGVVYT